jgi:D-alanyl-D-alanine carboxypeptidase
MSVLKTGGRIVALIATVMIVFCADMAGARHRRYTDPDLDAALVIEAGTGKVLYARNDAAPRHPASLTKLMTLYLLFEKLHAHALTSAAMLPVSPYAASQPRAHLRLRAGSAIDVETAIKALVVCSANDVAVVVAEALAGSEQNFVVQMNGKARALGMMHTVYRNASGLPDDLQVTTADDLAILARHLIYDYPQYFSYFSTASMEWRGREINTHDYLIGNYRGADGLKTGYTDASGYNLVSTAMRGHTRLIAVLMGGLSAERRDEAMVDLLDDWFSRLQAGG